MLCVQLFYYLYFTKYVIVVFCFSARAAKLQKTIKRSLMVFWSEVVEMGGFEPPCTKG